MKTMIIATALALLASPALAVTKKNCQGTGTNYDKQNCQRDNANSGSVVGSTGEWQGSDRGKNVPDSVPDQTGSKKK